jgi:hypothetical protein
MLPRLHALRNRARVDDAVIVVDEMIKQESFGRPFREASSADVQPADLGRIM